jgi:hypothetical protein
MTSTARTPLLQVEALQAQLAAAQAQLSEAYREKAAALQDVVSATSQVAPLKEQVQGLVAQLAQVGGSRLRCPAVVTAQRCKQYCMHACEHHAGACSWQESGFRFGAWWSCARAQRSGTACLPPQVTTERGQLQAQLAAVQAELEQERAVRQLVASEVEAARQAAAAAKTAAERAAAENAALVGRLMDLKAREAEKLNEINNMHEELVRGGELQGLLCVSCCWIQCYEQLANAVGVSLWQAIVINVPCQHRVALEGQRKNLPRIRLELMTLALLAPRSNQLS